MNVPSPELPFQGQLPAIQDGFLICFKGQSWPNAKKLVIQVLQTTGDVVLSIDVVFDCDGVAVGRSCALEGRSKRKEVNMFDFMPHRGRVFEIILLVTSRNFKCAINGHHAFDFPIFCRLEEIISYKVSGHCDVARISYQTPKPQSIQEGGGMHPRTPRASLSAAGQIKFPAMFPPANGNPMSPPPIGFLSSYSPPSSVVPPRTPSISGDGRPGLGRPVMLTFPNGIPAHRVINFYASTFLSSQWFKISFKTSEKSSDCAFIVYVNFANGDVLRNSCHDNVMGERESSIPFFPFMPGKSFFIMFLCLPDMFKMAVNQCHFLEFRHRRLSLEDVHCVVAEGDIEVSNFYDVGN